MTGNVILNGRKTRLTNGAVVSACLIQLDEYYVDYLIYSIISYTLSAGVNLYWQLHFCVNSSVLSAIIYTIDG